MKVKCTKCGLEQEGNFCSQCGTSLPKAKSLEEKQNDVVNSVAQHTISKNSNISSFKDVAWTEKCPIRKKGKLWYIKQKTFLGLSSSPALKCMN